MAVSAFKSTTRRRCMVPPSDQGPNNASSRVPSQEHLLPQHHKLKYHRRSSSFTDLSPYSRNGGPSSPRVRANRALRFLDRQLSEGDLMKTKPINEEVAEDSAAVPNDADAVAIHRLGSSHERPLRVPESSFRDQFPEGQVEEKIIEAVYAQKKPKSADPVFKDKNEMYKMIKAEVFQVIADMKDVIENSQLFMVDPQSADDKSSPSFGEEIVKVFQYVCKGYAAKVNKVEEEVKQLRLQLAEKEKTCLDLTNFINELIPECATLHVPSKSQKQHEGVTISVDAFEQETGSSAPFMTSRSILDDDARAKRLSGEDVLLQLEKECEQREWGSSSAEGKAATESKDGVILPWLRWEEAGSIRYHPTGNAKQKDEHVSSEALSSHDMASLSQSKAAGNELSVLNASQGAGHGKEEKDDGDASESITYTMRSRSIRSCNEAIMHAVDSSLLYIKSAEVISERIEFQARIDAGELLLCIGTLQIF